MAVPPYNGMFNSALRALKELGGSCSISEMSDRVAMILELSEEDVNAVHKGNITKLEYRLAWTRNYRMTWRRTASISPYPQSAILISARGWSSIL